MRKRNAMGQRQEDEGNKERNNKKTKEKNEVTSKEDGKEAGSKAELSGHAWYGVF